MNNKNIYEMINDMDINSSDYEPIPLSGMEKRRIKKAVKNSSPKKFRHLKPIIAASLFTMCILTATVWKNDVYALVKSLQYKLNLFTSAENIENYVQALNSTVTDNNISVTLNEVVMDNDELIITTTLVLPEADENILWADPQGTLKINDSPIIGGASGSIVQTDTNIFESYMSYDISQSSIDPNKTHIVDYNFNGIDIIYTNQTESKTIKGEWNFKFSAEGSELLADTYVSAVNDTIELPDNSQICLTTYTSNALGQKIYFDIPQGNGLDYHIELRGKDDAGEEIVFYMAQTTGTQGLFKIETIDNGFIRNDAKILTLTPFVVEFPKESGKMNSDYKPLDTEIIINLD